MTPREWAKAFLATMGYPQSDSNVASMVAWASQEGGHYAEPTHFNPLNTSLPMPGSYGHIGHPIPDHIQAYVSWDQGLEATKRTLLSDNPRWKYGPIREALAASLPPERTLQFIKESSWGTTALQPLEWMKYQAYGDHPDPIGGHASIATGAAPSKFGTVAKLGAGAFAVVIGLSLISRGTRRG